MLGSSQAASRTASTSNISGRLGPIPDEVLHTLKEPLRNSGNHQSSPGQEKPGSTPLSLRALTPVPTEVGHLEFVGERLIGGKSHGRVPPAAGRAVAAHSLDLRQIASTEASDGETSDSNLPKADRPNQPSPHPEHTRSSGLGGTTSSELPSASPHTGRGGLVDRTTGVKPVRVSETPGAARGEVLPRFSPQPAGDPRRSRIFAQPSGHTHNAPLRTEVEHLKFVGERLIRGKSHSRVPPAAGRAAAAHGLDLRQIASTEAPDGKTSDSNLPKADRPNQPSPHPEHTRSSGLGGTTSSDLPSASPQTGRGRLVDRTAGVKPVRVSETPGPARGEVLLQHSEVLPQPSDEPRRSQVFLQPSGHTHNELLREAGALDIRFSEKMISDNTEPVASPSPVRREPVQESHALQSRQQSSARDQQPQLSDREAGSPAFPEVGSNSAVVTRAIPEVSPLTGLPPNDSASFRGGPRRGAAGSPQARVYATGTHPPTFFSGSAGCGAAA